MRPVDLPLMENKPHGTRARYVAAKCRCSECRAANSAYYHVRKAKGRELAADLVVSEFQPRLQEWTARDGVKRTRIYKRGCPGVLGKPCSKQSHLRKDSKGPVCSVCRDALSFNGLVPVDGVLAHLAKLSKLGVGYKSVADAASVSRSSLAAIMRGDRLQIRAQAERRILAVDEGAMAGGALVPRGRIRQQLAVVMNEVGLTKGALAQELGAETKSLQVGKRRKVRASTKHKVEKLYRQTLAHAAMPVPEGSHGILNNLGRGP